VAASVFHEGADEQATLTNTFTVSGVATDPTAISLAVTTPAGTTSTYTYALAEITKTSTGVYTKDIACTEDGVWKYVWTGTGTASDVVAGTWTVFTADLQRNYCTVEELKSRLGMAATDTADDFEIRLAVDTASREIDDWCQDQFWRSTATRTFTADCAYLLDLGPYPLISVTTLKTDQAGDGTFETTWSASDYQLLPLNVTTLAEPKPYRQIKSVASNTFPYGRELGARDDRVEIVGVYGWPTVPAAVKQACLIHAAELLKLKDAPFGVAGFGDFGPVRVRMNARAQALLSPYRRLPVLVG
jgi:hypothetical protein